MKAAESADTKAAESADLTAVESAKGFPVTAMFPSLVTVLLRRFDEPDFPGGGTMAPPVGLLPFGGGGLIIADDWSAALFSATLDSTVRGDALISADMSPGCPEVIGVDCFCGAGHFVLSGVAEWD